MTPAPYDFTDKTAVVTGAASGFGLATAQLLAVGGAQVVAVDRNSAKLEIALAQLPQVSSRAHTSIVADLRPAEASARVIADAAGVSPNLDILVNSAGVCHFHRMSDVAPAEWDEVLETDLRALFYMSTAFAERVDPLRGGRIINLGSNAGRKGRALSAHYAAAKAGVANLGESLALAYGSKNVTANTVCPAVVLTPLWNESFAELGSLTGKSPEQLAASWQKATPLGRLGTVEDVANLIVFLASDRAGFITGQTINVCGGFMLTC